MQQTLAVLILVPIAAMLIFSGLFILAIVAIGLIAGVEGITAAVRHRMGHLGQAGQPSGVRHIGHGGMVAHS